MQQGEETNKEPPPRGVKIKPIKNRQDRAAGINKKLGSSPKQKPPALEGELTAEGRPGQQQEGEESTTGRDTQPAAETRQGTAPADGVREAGVTAGEDSNP